VGIIRAQAIKGTIYTYTGVALGFLTTGILMPYFFSTAQNGLINLLISYSQLFASFALLGFNSVTMRLFPFFRDYAKQHNGFLSLSLSVITIGFIISMIGFYFISPLIIASNVEKSALFVDYILYIIPLTFFPLVFQNLDAYYTGLYNAVSGIFLKELVQRVFILCAILLFYFQFFQFDGFIFT